MSVGSTTPVSRVGALLRDVLSRADERAVRFPLEPHVPEALFREVAAATHQHAVEHAVPLDDDWMSYRDGILGWWGAEASLSVEERRRLHKFRSDVVRSLTVDGVMVRDHPRSTLLRVRLRPEADTVSRAPRNPPWCRDEIVLALELFVSAGCVGGGHLPGKSDPRVVELSGVLRELALHPVSARGTEFRNATGVALKLANFRAIEHDLAADRSDDTPLPRGMARYSALDRAIVEEFWNRWEDLRSEGQSILSGAADRPSDPHETVRTRPLEEQHVDEYESVAVPAGVRRRTEATLVAEFARWMSARGHAVVGRDYWVPGEARPLRCDAFVPDLNVLVEAKAFAGRASVRLAVGQLLDYARFERQPLLALLVPHEPLPDLQTFLNSVGVGWIWPHGGDGFKASARPLLGLAPRRRDLRPADSNLD